MKAQQVQDDAVRGLAESLREMVGVANKIPDLLVVDGTDNVIEAISRVLLQVASVIDEYARLPFIGVYSVGSLRQRALHVIIPGCSTDATKCRVRRFKNSHSTVAGQLQGSALEV